MQRRRIIIGTLLITGLALVLAVFSPMRNAMVSFVVMKIHSGIHQEESLLEEKEILLKIPGGNQENGWYPFVMTFTDDRGFSRFLGREAEFTVLYNFPAFSWETGASELYDTESDRYSSFYGAYLVEIEGREPFGFSTEGQMKPEEAVLAAEYDYLHLVLEDFGLEPDQAVFEAAVQKVQEDVALGGYSDWTRIEADLLVNGASHSPDGWGRSYLQYGRPAGERREEFIPVSMTGILYGRYDTKKDLSLFLYVMCKDREEAFRVEELLLKQVVIESRKEK